MYNFKMRLFIIIYTILFLVAPAFVEDNKPVLQDIDYTAVVEQKMKLEGKLENYINRTLEDMLGEGKASIKLDITPNVEKSRVETESWAKQLSSEGEGAVAQGPKAQEFLPGIPMKQEIVQKETEQSRSGQTSGQKRSIESIVKVPEAFIKKISAVLIISDEYPEEELIRIKQFVIDVLDINYERGDKLLVKKVRFSPGFKKLERYLTNPFFYLALLVALLCLIFFRFLFSLLKTLVKLKEMKSEVNASGDVAGGGGRGGGGVGVGGVGEISDIGGEGRVKSGEEGEEEKKLEFSEIIKSLPVPSEEVGKMAFKPFKFVEDKDIKKIAYLLVNENPELIATIMHYLDDEKALKLLRLLPEDKKADIITSMTYVKFGEQAKVACLERIIKRRIDLISGGVDRLMSLMNVMDDESKKKMMSQISSSNPEMAEKVKKMMFSFENLVGLEDRTLQVILAEINASDFAVALKGVDEEFKSRIMANLSEAAGKIVNEELETGKAAGASEVQVANQRRAIITQVRAMEAAGKIDLGGIKEIAVLPEELSEISGKSIMEEVEEELRKEKKREEEKLKRREKIGIIEEEPPVKDNEKAFIHYSNGGDYFQEGNYEMALSEFQESLKYNPEIWQTYQYIGSSLYALGKESEAVRAYEKSLELNPENEELKKWLDEHKPGVAEPEPEAGVKETAAASIPNAQNEKPKTEAREKISQKK